MKRILPVLFLFVGLLCLFPSPVQSAVIFTISNPVKEGDYFIVDASISGISSSSAYVQGMFTATSTASYFGYTWGQNEEWVNYVGSTTKDFISQNFPILQKNVSQKIWIKPNYKDSAYKGPGDYLLKLKRYTGASDNSTGEDAVLTLSLTETLPTPTPTPMAEVTTTPAPTEPAWTPNPTKTPTPTPTPSPTKTSVIAPLSASGGSASGAIPANGSSSAVLGDSTDSSSFMSNLSGLTEDATSESKTKPLGAPPYKVIFFLGLGIASSSGALLYLRFKKG